MRIDIKNIFGSGSSSKPVDVKQAMEDEEERAEADLSSEDGNTPSAKQGTVGSGPAEAGEDPAVEKMPEVEQQTDGDVSSGDVVHESGEGQDSAQEAKREKRADAESSLEDAPSDDSAHGAETELTVEQDKGTAEIPSDEGQSDLNAETDFVPASASDSDAELVKASAESSRFVKELSESVDLEAEAEKGDVTGEDDSDAPSGSESEIASAAAHGERADLKAESSASEVAEAETSAEQVSDAGEAPDAESEQASNASGATEPKASAEQSPSGSEDADAKSELSSNSSAASAKAEASRKTGKKIFALCCRYGWCSGIAAAFIILLAVTLIYTTMTPREVYATINDEEFNFTTTEYTVEEFLQDEEIAFCDEDYISLPLTTYIYDGMKLEIDHATDFKVTVDGKTKNYKTLDSTVQEALADAGVKLGDKDIVTPALDTFMTEDIHIVVQRVEVRQETAEEAVPFQTVTRNDSSLKEGTTEVTTKGQDGIDKVTYEVTYIDGVETSRIEIARESVTAAVDEVVAKGTRIDYNGKTYSKKLVVKAYAYTGGGRTAMGTRARVGEIAVDPSVIPLGKNVYIQGVGARRAEDTGGNIKGNTIDIYMNSEAECRRWGVRYVTIYIE